MIRPRDGLSPTTAQHEAGARIDPPPSLASAIGIIRDATAETAPPLEPPAVTPVFHGFARLYTDDEVLEHGLDFGKVQGDSG